MSSSYSIDVLSFRLKAMKSAAGELGLGYSAKLWEEGSIFTRVTLTGLPEEVPQQIEALNSFYARVDSKGKPETLPCITINPNGTVRVIVDGKVVDLNYSDYLISRESGKSPLSRVFEPKPPKIIKPNGDEEEY